MPMQSSPIQMPAADLAQRCLTLCARPKPDRGLFSVTLRSVAGGLRPARTFLPAGRLAEIPGECSGPGRRAAEIPLEIGQREGGGLQLGVFPADAAQHPALGPPP